MYMTCFLRATRKGLGKQLGHIMGRKHDSLLQRGHVKMHSIININIYVNRLLLFLFFFFFPGYARQKSFHQRRLCFPHWTRRWVSCKATRASGFTKRHISSCARGRQVRMQQILHYVMTFFIRLNLIQLLLLPMRVDSNLAALELLIVDKWRKIFWFSVGLALPRSIICSKNFSLNQA